MLFQSRPDRSYHFYIQIPAHQSLGRVMRNARGETLVASPLSLTSNSNSDKATFPYMKESSNCHEKQEPVMGPAWSGTGCAYITAENPILLDVSSPVGWRRILSAERSVTCCSPMSVSYISTELLIHLSIFSPGPSSAVMVMEELEPSVANS